MTAVMFQALLCVFSCGRNTSYIHDSSMTDNVSSLYDTCRKLTENREFEKLTAITVPLLNSQSKIPEDLRNYLCLKTGESYIFMDSLKKGAGYIQQISAEDFESPGMKASYYNTMGIMAIKSSLDYSLALTYFRQSAELTIHDTAGHCAAICNIAELYYERKDTAGIYYAIRAHELAEKTGNIIASCYSSVQAGYLFLLAGSHSDALHFATTALSTADTYKLDNYKNSIKVLLGKIHSSMQKYDRAVMYFQEVLADTAVEPSIKREACYEYGMTMTATGDYDKAEKLLLRSAGLYYSTGNIEDLLPTLKGLSALYMKTEAPSKALRYYAILYRLSDSLSIDQKERDFNHLLMNYEKAWHNERIQEKETALHNSRIRLLLTAMLFVTALSAAALATHAWRKKNEMYARLAEQHDRLTGRMRNLERTIAEMHAVSSATECNSKDAELWRDIQALMSEDSCAYRQKDMSLEKLAEILGSNRTYVSRVVNKYAGVSFPAYLNLKRIGEAARCLQDSEDNTSVKTLADILGYNSTSAFVRAFSREMGCPPAKYRELHQSVQHNKDS